VAAAGRAPAAERWLETLQEVTPRHSGASAEDFFGRELQGSHGSLPSVSNERKSGMHDNASESVQVRAKNLKTQLRRAESSLFSGRNSIIAMKNKKVDVEARRTRMSGEEDRIGITQSVRENVDRLMELRPWNAREKLRQIISSPQFHLLAGVIILVNAAAVGVETELYAQTGHADPFMMNFGSALNLWFVFEVALGITAFGKEYFMDPKDYFWNWFDFLLAMMSILDLLIDLSSQANLLRLMRVVRILRSLRLVRWMQHMREFKKMIFSMAVSIQTLVWAVVLLLFVQYVFGIWFTSQCVPFIKEWRTTDPASAEVLEEFFGSLMQSMYSLWLSISGGISWYYIVIPLFKVSPWVASLFILYILITVLGLMNIVTSVFVESAMRSTQHYRDLLLQEKNRSKEMFGKHLREIFRSIDVDQSGMINMDELKEFLADDSLELKAYLQALELDAEDAKALFKLLDNDGSGEIDIAEFCDGCMRLKGEAKSFDINCLLYDSKRKDQKLRHIMDGVDVIIGMMLDLLGVLGISEDATAVAAAAAAAAGEDSAGQLEQLGALHKSLSRLREVQAKLQLELPGGEESSS